MPRIKKNKIVEEPVVESTPVEAVEEAIAEESVIEESITVAKTEKIINTECLNIRKKANGEVICQLYRNTPVIVESEKDGWTKISKPVKGYCKTEYLI